MLEILTRLLILFLILVIASLLARFSGRLTGGLLWLGRGWLFQSWRPGRPAPLEPTAAPADRQTERERTLQQLLTHVLNIVIVAVAVGLSLGQFTDVDTVLWVLGFFSTALAFAGRVFVGDLLSGLSIIFQDKYVVGEKIQILTQMERLEGMVERVNLRNTHLRARTGELYIIFNGEMNFVRNYSRGPYSATTIKLRIPTNQVVGALPLLTQLGSEASRLYPDLKEPWLVVSEDGTMSNATELTLALKTEFGRAATLRPQLMNFLCERLTLAGIPLAP